YGLWFFMLQESIKHFPIPLRKSPKVIAGGNFLETPDKIELNGWFVPTKDATYTIFFCHGNAGNISHRMEKLKFFQELGANIFIFDYRGYGRSKGVPSEKGLYNDVQGAYNYLLSRKILPEQIIGYGESIGGAVIIDLASRNRLAALIIDSAFSNFKDMVKTVYPFLPYWVLASRWDSLSKIRAITVPKLIIHSINDEIVPYKLGRKLFESAPEAKEFLKIRGGHNSSFFESEQILREKIADFLKRLSK
ncbi:MAG: alpha/beta hydrolase, partial [Candidatus Omnitrophota bacterium]|nr:alpha/beta hydrolase [Candidatus Omnitrophota bacterium]